MSTEIEMKVKEFLEQCRSIGIGKKKLFNKRLFWNALPDLEDKDFERKKCQIKMRVVYMLGKPVGPRGKNQKKEYETVEEIGVLRSKIFGLGDDKLIMLKPKEFDGNSIYLRSVKQIYVIDNGKEIKILG